MTDLNSLLYCAIQGGHHRLPPEREQGHCEYKLTLDAPCPARLEQLTTQLHWRLTSSAYFGRAIYEIGVDDDGSLIGLSRAALDRSLETLKRMAEGVHARIEKVLEHSWSVQQAARHASTKRSKRTLVAQGVATVHCSENIIPVKELGLVKFKNGSAAHVHVDALRRYVAEVHIYKDKHESSSAPAESRLVLCGDSQSGKTTLIVRLSQGICDNGAGASRMRLLRHRHEILTGRTSSLVHACVTMDAKGHLIYPTCAEQESTRAFAAGQCDGDDEKEKPNDNESGEQSVNAAITSARYCVTLLDTAGHARYLDQTLRALTTRADALQETKHDAVLFTLTAQESLPPSQLTRDLMATCVALDVPCCVCVTKLDLLQDPLHLQSLLKWLFNFWNDTARRKCLLLDDESSLEEIAGAAEQMMQNQSVPVLCISTVTDEQIQCLSQLLRHTTRPVIGKMSNVAVEFRIEQVFRVSGVGTVVGGTLASGQVHCLQQLHLGPDRHGRFIAVQIKSIHRQSRQSVSALSSGQSATFALSHLTGTELVDARAGMVLVDANSVPLNSLSTIRTSRKCVRELEAFITVICAPAPVRTRHRGVLHAGTVRQIATLVAFDTANAAVDSLVSGCRAQVTLRFLLAPEYLRLGTRIVYRNGPTKLIGQVTRLL